MMARNRDRLQKLEHEITNAKAYICDVGDLKALLATLQAIRSEIGHPSVLVHNAVSATFGTFLEADPEDLERNFRVNAASLLYLARELVPAMVKRAMEPLSSPETPLPTEAFPPMLCLLPPRQPNES